MKYQNLQAIYREKCRRPGIKRTWNGVYVMSEVAREW